MITSTASTATTAHIRAAKVEEPPNAGKLWKGVPHIQLCARLMDMFNFHKWGPTEFRAHLSRDEADLVCSWLFTDLGPRQNNRVLPSLGLVTSNARRKALTFFVGVCDVKNEAALISTDFQGGRYTQNFDLAEEVDKAVKKFLEELPRAWMLKRHLTDLVLTEDDVAKILFTAARQRIIPWSRAGAMDTRWRKNPKEFKTGWDLMRLFQQFNRYPSPDVLGQLLLFTQLLPKPPSAEQFIRNPPALLGAI